MAAWLLGCAVASVAGDFKALLRDNQLPMSPTPSNLWRLYVPTVNVPQTTFDRRLYVPTTDFDTAVRQIGMDSGWFLDAADIAHATGGAYYIGGAAAGHVGPLPTTANGTAWADGGLIFGLAPAGGRLLEVDVALVAGANGGSSLCTGGCRHGHHCVRSGQLPGVCIQTPQVDTTGADARAIDVLVLVAIATVCFHVWDGQTRS